MRAAAAFCMIAMLLAGLPARAQDTRFVSYTYQQKKQYAVSCAAHLECSVTLLPGEKINDAYIGDAAAWHPQVAYAGAGDAITPQIVVRADRPGIATNVIVNTTARTYYFEFRATSGDVTYYNFATPRPPRQMTQFVSYAPAAVVTPAPALEDAPLEQICTDGNFQVDAQPAEWRPVQVCDDGRHTYIQLAQLAQSREDVPIVHAVQNGNEQALVNYQYHARTSRYVVDGVYPELALVGGTPAQPFTLRVLHAAASLALATPAPTPTPIVTPAAVMGPHGPILYTPPPAIAAAATPAPDPQSFAQGTDPTPGPASTAPSGPMPILNAAGQVVAYTTADLAGRNGFLPVLDGSGNIIGYTITPQGVTSPQLISTGPNRCPVSATPDTMWNSKTLNTSTNWSRNFRYAAQGVDTLVTVAAIAHGAKSTGIFHFLRSPVGFLVAQAAENWLADQATKHACPSTVNVVNTVMGASAVINALKSSAKP